VNKISFIMKLAMLKICSTLFRFICMQFS